jgi:HEAT repeat protein
MTHALLRPETALAAIEALRGMSDRAAVEGLVELLYDTSSARAATAAVSALEGRDDPPVLDALTAALDSPHASVRIVAVQSLHQRRADHVTETFVRLLTTDESWLVRRAALRALADQPAPDRWRILHAATDPHWRVRHALIRVLLEWGATDESRRDIDQRLAWLGEDVRVEGVRVYLTYRWSGRAPEEITLRPEEDPNRLCLFWDWDVAVLARNLERMGASGRREALDVMPWLLTHPDGRVRALALDTLRAHGEARHLAAAVALLDEPRKGTVESVGQLLSGVNLDRIEETARFILRMSNPSPGQLAWALDQAEVAFPAQEEESILLDFIAHTASLPPCVRAAVVRLRRRLLQPEVGSWLRHFLDDATVEVQLEALRGLNEQAETGLDIEVVCRLLRSGSPHLRAEAIKSALAVGADVSILAPLAEDRDAAVRASLAGALVLRTDGRYNSLLARLQSDVNPRVRAAALPPAVAAELIAAPDRETSWHVLAKAARMARVPLWEIEPERPWQPVAGPDAETEPLRPSRPAPPHARLLGPDALSVAPVGISGHYGLPVEGFVRAVEAGVNLLFWEPNYQTLTDFMNRLSSSDRNALHVIAGTFEADGERVRRDAERVLRMLKIDRVAIFLLFWVQSWDRIVPDVREALERLKGEGKVASFGLSTHSRPLAIDAMEAGWNPVMVRHSAAHRGAEPHVLPRAVELGTSIITFNNTCYGRLLKPHAGSVPPSAADCYRYTLEQPGVRACWSAPATLDQLEENLAALRDPILLEDRRPLRAHGDLVYQEDSTFRKLVRAL